MKKIKVTRYSPDGQIVAVKYYNESSESRKDLGTDATAHTALFRAAMKTMKRR